MLFIAVLLLILGLIVPRAGYLVPVGCALLLVGLLFWATSAGAYHYY